MNQAAEPISEQEEQELAYSELYDTLILCGEIIITIPASEEERTKTGIKNHKARIATKAEEEGIVIDRTYLTFESVPNLDFPDCIDLRIILKKPATIKIKKLVIPEQLPE